MPFIRLCWLAIALLTIISTSACAPRGNTLYVFDVSDLHLNHYEHCIGLTGQHDRCDSDTPPPSGKTYQDLLQDYDTLIFLTTLQGIVNRHRPQLYLLHDHQRGDTPGVDEFWLQIYQEQGQPYGWLADMEIVHLNSLQEVLDTFANQVEGLVEWDPDVPATLNVATTIAGVENLAVVRHGSQLRELLPASLVVKQSLLKLFSAEAITLPNSDSPASGSPKLDAYRWAKEKYLDTGRANPTLLAYFLDGWPATLYTQNQMTRGGVYALERDYVVQQQGFAFDLSPWPDELPNDDPHQSMGGDAALFKEILIAAEQQAGDFIKVWGFIPWYEKYSSVVGSSRLPTEGEWESTWLISQHGGYLQGGGGDVFGVAMANISMHKFGPSPATRARPSLPDEADLIAQGYLTPAGEVAPDKTFVMFYAGDYDLTHPTQVLLGNYAVRPWLDEKRGQIPLAWGFNPGMQEEIPAMMSYFYASQTPNDYFVAANSGAGYLNPDGLSDTAFLRWLTRSGWYYGMYGYNVQGFLLNGNGAHISQRRLDAFTLLTPVGILSPNYQTDEPWPRLQRGTPVSGLPPEALAGTPDIAAEAVHTVYKRIVLKEGRPPFLAFRSAFQAPTFLWGVQDRMQAHDAADQITGPNGEVLHPNYTLVDPYTFFFLLERWLEE